MKISDLETFLYFQNWCAENVEDAKKQKIMIGTLDNPGWSIFINLGNFCAEDKKTEKIERSENDWIFWWVKDNSFESAGGPKNLTEMLNIFKHLTKLENFQNRVQRKVYENSGILGWLQNWYASQCDGMWEHGYGVRIDITSDFMWRVKIGLFDTFWSGKEILPSKKEISTGNWIHYKVHENIFEATGGIRNLEDILNLFKKWITTNVM